PKDPVKIGDKWTEMRQVNMGLYGVGTPIELTYLFRGWQRRDGTNCARIDFTGLLKPGAPPPPRGTNQPPGRPMVMRGGSGEEGTLQGQTWYNPDLELGVETSYGQTITRRSTTSRFPNPRRVMKTGAGGTNTVVVTDPSGAPPDGSSPPP